MFKLAELPYSYDALEPYIDRLTMEIHHQKHHGGYVEKLNKALTGDDGLADLEIGELLGKIDKVPVEMRQAVVNNGGGHANHSLFWEIMGPKSERALPEGKLKEAIESSFGGLDVFKEKFSDKAIGLFGSGWVFLEVSGRELNIKRHSFQNSPLMHGKRPILGIDVWEHAYYLKYQNRRADYIEAWWKVVNWAAVSELFLKVS